MPTTEPHDEVWGDPTGQIVAFLREIGLEVQAAELPDDCFLPGIQIERGALLIDSARLRYPGDLLHEAGHMAVAAPERRASIVGDAGPDPAEEMMAIAWSYAAALHLGLGPELVFHDGGYHGDSASLIENFGSGRYFGVPMLQWLGMAYEPGREASGARPYPAMQRWLRES